MKKAVTLRLDADVLGLVQTAGMKLADENQSGAAEVDVGTEEDLGGMSRGCSAGHFSKSEKGRTLPLFWPTFCFGRRSKTKLAL
jgi:hypothetical protein